MKLSSKTRNLICRFRFQDKTKTSRQRIPVQNWETINWWTNREVRLTSDNWQYLNRITSLHHLSGSSNVTWTLRPRIKPCLRTNRASNTSITLPSTHLNKVTKATDADLEEDQKSKRVCNRDNSWRRALEEVLREQREFSMIQREAFKLPKLRRSRRKWKRQRDPLNQVDITHRSSRRFHMNKWKISKIAVNEPRSKLPSIQAWDAVQKDKTHKNKLP